MHSIIVSVGVVLVVVFFCFFRGKTDFFTLTVLPTGNKDFSNLFVLYSQQANTCRTCEYKVVFRGQRVNVLL